MKSKIILKYYLPSYVAVIIAAFIGLTGCSKESNSKVPDNQVQKTAERKDTKDLSIVRDKNVNVASLDQDKDGNLYQCEMDYDVISDNPGKCPKCGMQLKKVSVAEAKKYLDASNGNE